MEDRETHRTGMGKEMENLTVERDIGIKGNPDREKAILGGRWH